MCPKKMLYWNVSCHFGDPEEGLRSPFCKVVWSGRKNSLKEFNVDARERFVLVGMSYFKIWLPFCSYYSARELNIC